MEKEKQHPDFYSEPEPELVQHDIEQEKKDKARKIEEALIRERVLREIFNI